ncbi:heparinase II/III domain-containing protein [Membranihabitans maritimus]|uniref:heparinase II/III domain-containing protein n=1 Tax=Membranihabitans maritimus TaxID=2904244 RepID=UPI001F24442D|nr:heparinase II/III family protein [Membranihabitans maritimus]
MSYSKIFNKITSILLLIAVSFSLSYTQGVSSKDNTLAFPPKSQSLIYSEKDIAYAREKIENNETARQIADAIIQSAEEWSRWADKDLIKLIPEASVPRSFDLNVNGCPVHGDSIFKVGDKYPWILDPKKQFKVQCPIGKEYYPSNDFEPSEVEKDPLLLSNEKKYVDKGWGWLAPDGEKYWFVAYANQWFFRDYVQPAIQDLGRAYLLTGKEIYAHKALVLLHRLAEVYPAMDYEDQSRYGQMQKKNGSIYPGKVLNRIWETWFIQDAAECYDMVWSSISKDQELQNLLSKNGIEIQSFIESNLLEEAVEAYLERKIQGNFGMHQIALLYVLMARQNMNNAELIDRLINHTSKEYLQTGVNYALYNFVFRDGMPMESPGYNFLWLKSITRLFENLKDFDINLFKDERVESILRSPLEITVDNKYTVDIGDSGSTLGGVIGRDENTYATAFRNYGDSAFLTWIGPLLEGKSTEQLADKSRFETLFHPDIKVKTKAIEKRESKLFAGYGMGLLQSKNSSSSLALTYGMHGSHYHWDFLNFELFSHGQKMMPDFGYPDAMNAYVPGIYTWSKNTIAHNTVVVNASKQENNLPGTLHQFNSGTFVQSIDASSPAYSSTEKYRRHLMMIDTDGGNSYTIDFFRVQGGERHDYILHGPPGEVKYNENEWSDAQPGTYAGENVQRGEIYDNNAMSAEGYSGGYTGYNGSGFQHLFNVRKSLKGEGVLEFSHINDPDARLKLRILSANGQQLSMATSFDHPRSKVHRIQHLISHSEAGISGDSLKSTFTGIMELYNDKSFISSVQNLKLEGGIWSRAVEVVRDSETDIIISDTENFRKSLEKYSLKTDARAAVITLGKDNKLKRVFFADGTFLSVGNQTFNSTAWKGTVEKVDYNNKRIHLAPEDLNTPSNIESLNKGVVFFSNGLRKTEHPVNTLEVGKNELIVRPSDDLLIGRINVSLVDDDKNVLESNNVLVFEETYIGAYILDEKYQVIGKVESIHGDKIVFSGDVSTIFKNKEAANIWIANIAKGEKAWLQTNFEWQSK